MHQRIVYQHLNRWRNLKAWGRSLANVDLYVSPREYPKRAGTCWPALQRVIVYHQPGLRGLVGMLKTGLHEFAHAVETEGGHGPSWESRYGSAVAEVTGTNTMRGGSLDEACYRALLVWWRESGAEREARRMLNV